MHVQIQYILDASIYNPVPGQEGMQPGTAVEAVTRISPVAATVFGHMDAKTSLSDVSIPHSWAFT